MGGNLPWSIEKAISNEVKSICVYQEYFFLSDQDPVKVADPRGDLTYTEYTHNLINA